MYTLTMRVFWPLSSIAVLSACAAAVQKPTTRYDFDDSLVQQSCECAAPRRLKASDAIGELTVAQQRSSFSRTWRGPLQWHTQPWLDVPRESSRVTVRLNAKDAYEVTCTEASRELSCFDGAFFEVAVALRSDDGLLDDTFDVHLRFLPEPVIHQPVELPAKLETRRTESDVPTPYLALIFDGAAHGELYISHSSEPGVSEAHPIARWQLDADQAAAANALRFIPGDDVLATLREVVTTDPEPAVRVNAIQAAGERAPHEALFEAVFERIGRRRQ